MKAKIGDCFLMHGSTIEEPMTLYLVKKIIDEKIIALSVLIKKQMVQSWDPWDSINTYDNDIPNEAVFLPKETFDIVTKKKMDFLEEIWNYIETNLVENISKTKIEVGKHYYNRGFIYTIDSIGEERFKSQVFRLERENISPYWSGDDRIECGEDYKLIKDGVYEEVKHRYDDFVQDLRKLLFTKE